MSRLLRRLASSIRGSAAVQFAIVIPVLILLLVGIAQVGMLGLARAGMGQGVEAGARYATIYPRPTDTQISARVLANAYGLRSSNVTGPTFLHGTTNGSPYVDITMRYSMSLNFGIYRTPAITLSYTRRAYQL